MTDLYARWSLRRLGAAVATLACCATVAACTNGLADNGTEPPDPIAAEWQLAIETDAAAPEPTQAVIDGDELFVWGHVGVDDDGVGLVAFDLATGEELWHADTKVYGAWVTDAAIVAETMDSEVTVLDRTTGKPRFELDGADHTNRVAVTADGVAVLKETTDDFTLVFHDLDSGSQLWSEEVRNHGPAIEAHIAAPAEAPKVHGTSHRSKQLRLRIAQDSPLLYVHAQAGDASGMYAAHAVSDGEQRMTTGVDATTEAVPKGFMTVSGDDNVVTLVGLDNCSATYAIVDDDFVEREVFEVHGGQRCEVTLPSVQENYGDDMLYGVDYDGQPQLLDADTGEIMWTATEEGVPFAYVDGVATYGRDGYAKAVDIDSGEQLWDWDYESMESDGYKFNEIYSSNLYGANGDVVMLGSVWSTHALDADNGEPLWASRSGAVDFNDEYVVLREGVDTQKQTLQVAKIDGG